MPESLTEEQKRITDFVRRFVRRRILPLESGGVGGPTAEERLALAAEVKEAGLFGLDLPKEYGGAGLDFHTRILVGIEAAQHRAGLVDPCYGAFGPAGIAPHVLTEATPEQQKRYLHPLLKGEAKVCFALTEAGGGSDPANTILTTATRVGDEWEITGSKLYVTNANSADFALVFARTVKGDDDGITCFIVPTSSEGFRVPRIIETLSRSHPTTAVELDHIRVPDSAILGELNGGFRIAMKRLTKQRIYYAASAAGVAKVASKMAIDYAKSREIAGAPLGTRQAIQWMVADNEIDVRHALHVSTEAAIAETERGKARLESAMAKLVATDAAFRVVDRAIQIFGGAGVTDDLPLAEWFKELRIRRLTEGSAEVQRILIARSLLGRELVP